MYGWLRLENFLKAELLLPMVHRWDITKNVPSAFSVEVWDKVGIYQIVSLGWSGEMAENGM